MKGKLDGFRFFVLWYFLWKIGNLNYVLIYICVKRCDIVCGINIWVWFNF